VPRNVVFFILATAISGMPTLEICFLPGKCFAPQGWTRTANGCVMREAACLRT